MKRSYFFALQCSDGGPFFILQVNVCGQLEVFAFVGFAAVYLFRQLLQIIHILNLIRVCRCAFPFKIRSFIFEYRCAVFLSHQQRNSFRQPFLAFLLRLGFLVRLLLQFLFFFFFFFFFFRFLFQFLFDFLLDFLKHFFLHELLLRHGTHRHRRYRKAHCRRNAYPFLPIHITPPSCAFADYGKAPISSAKISLVIIITWYHICFFSARKNKVNFSFWRK